jgi:hypothetical protein
MRNRGWRRYIERKILTKRLKFHVSVNKNWIFVDVNGKKIERPMIKDFINTDIYNIFKTYKTTKHDSLFKQKYSPNKSNFYRYKGTRKTREYDKSLFLKILKENGIK